MSEISQPVPGVNCVTSQKRAERRGELAAGCAVADTYAESQWYRALIERHDATCPAGADCRDDIFTYPPTEGEPE